MTDSTDQKTPRQISNCAEATDAAFGPAAWVWSHGEGRRYNDWAQFRLAFDWGEATEVDLVLTADSRYRLWVNGEPAGDGPVRGWPDHYYYDRRPLAKYLRKGGNEIRVAVQHYGGSSFHIVPQKGGFRAALWIEGKLAAHTGDGRWQVAELPERPVAAPRISVQMPPFEICDARLARATGWRAPEVLPAPQPWRVERLRDVVEPLREWVPAPAPVACRRLAPTPKVSAIPILQLLYPGRVREVIQRSHACALAAVAEVAEAGTFRWHAVDWELYIDGQRLEGGEWQAEAGGHRVLAVYRKLFHNEVDAAFGPPLDGIVWRHPLGEAAPEDSPWSFLPMEDFEVDAGDIHWLDHNARDLEAMREAYEARCRELGAATGTAEAFVALVRKEGRTVLREALFVPDPTAEFRLREPVGEQAVEVLTDGGLRIELPPDGEVELAFDFGDQKCGFLAFELEAPAGTVLDGHLVEYIRPDGVIQHTHENRNGFRYVAAGQGREGFDSMQRRSGRHLFLRLHGAAGTVVLRGLGLHESRYPATCPHPFRCSDATLSAIWAASDRTMQLSMDDVYIDSLYEQTLWVGDARNEQLYALAAYEAQDISLRSLRLAADSLDLSPMVNSQVPSCWETIIPIWSFLWVFEVREYYEFTGETEALRSLWPAVKRNLRAAAAQLNEDALFEAPWWNLFEWAHIDGAHRIVLHNTLFLIGAAEAALACATVLDDPDERDWLATLARRTRAAVRRMRDPESGLYPESIYRDGTVSPKFSIHTQFLAVLFGVAEGAEADHLLDRVEQNKGELVPIASPFALQFYGEAFEKRGRTDHVLEAMRRCFAPMLATGSTLWEALEGSATSPDGFPTRSHCHGWSACAMDFLPRIVLGLRPEGAAGSRSFVCSPRPHGLEWAEGCRMTPHGPVAVQWIIQGDACRVEIDPPPGVNVRFESNPVLEAAGLKLEGRTL